MTLGVLNKKFLFLFSIRLLVHYSSQHITKVQEKAIYYNLCKQIEFLKGKTTPKWDLNSIAGPKFVRNCTTNEETHVGMFCRRR